MAFDAKWEDYQRLLLRFALSRVGTNPREAAKAYTAFGRTYAQDRDSLPQTDDDRAFHLVAEATMLVDYKLPFATDEEAETIISHGHRLLEEALTLDPSCHDARRMDAASRCPSFESYYDFLREGEAEVRAKCEEARAVALRGDVPELVEIQADLAIQPHLRWQATLAEKALICGRNKETLRICDELLRADPRDIADTRFTASLAYAKLEDEQGLDQLEARCRELSIPRVPQDAWMLISRLSIAQRRRDFARARQLITKIAELYPNAIVTLARQQELPDGVFARLAVIPFSEDELVLAVSEATVLTQEGRDSLGRGTLGSWLLQECLSQATVKQLEELRKDIDMAALMERRDAGEDATGGRR